MPEVIADAELVARSRGRDAEAFGQLVERHQPLVFGVALARCGDPVLAEDVAQDAFVAAWRDLDRLRDAERVGPWVAGIARNLAVTAVRARARIEPLGDDARLANNSPEDEAIAREDRALLLRALADIPEAFREVLVLHYMDGASVTAIADALAIREDLVKQRLSRGRKALRESVAVRVESALARVRVKPGFRAGVMVAAASGAAIRTASAASAASAGKVLAIMTTKQLTIGIVAVLALAGGAIWLGTRRGSSGAAPARQLATQPIGSSSPAGASTGAGSRAVPRVHRVSDPAQRTAMLEAIRQQRTRRTGGASSSSAGSAPAPELPGVDMDKGYVRSAVRELIPLLSECYEEGLERDPHLAGDVVVDFTIEGEPGVGGVIGNSTVVPERSTIADPAVRECIQETMYAIQIDPPAGGGMVRVTYPFAFAPAPPVDGSGSAR
ncbi:hypothetical protein BH11MYX3_BH11MYX3_16580 [soil metagenome]